MRLSILLVVIVAAAAVAGCSNTLETGYKPRPLGASYSVRRSYYASPFTPESKPTEMDREQELERRRPRPGY